MDIQSVHYSDVSRWLRCGVQHEFVLSGLKIPPGISARRGTSVHKAGEHNHREKIRTGRDEPLSVLLDLAVETFRGYIRAGKYYLPPSARTREKAFVQETEIEVIGSVKVYHRDIAPLIRPVDVERTLSADVGLGVPIEGTRDLKDDRNVIIDLKTMKTKNQDWADRELQPLFYHVLEAAESGEWPAGFDYHLMVPNKTVKHVKISTSRTPKDIGLLKRYVAAYLNDMKSGVFRPADPTHWVCSQEYCGYFQICKYTRR